MTKSDISYASVPSTSDGQGPYVQGFAVGDSQAVTVIVDENNRNPYANQDDPFVGSTRRPVELALCPKCHATNVRTRTRTYPTLGTWVGAVGVGICFFPLFWVPLVVDTCKQTDHYCQACNQKLASIKPLEGCCVKEQH